MGMDNTAVISQFQKDFMGVGKLKAGGLMNPTQANKFIRMMQDEPTLLNDVRTERMNSDNQVFDKIGFGERVLRPAKEFTPLADSEKAVARTGKIELSAKEVIAEINISDDMIENNIEGKSVTDTIVQLLAKQAAMDIEELIVNGDIDSQDAYLALFDGLLKQSQSHIVDLQGEAINKDAFKHAIKAVPSRYRKNIVDHRFYVSHNNVMEWKDSVVARQTALGDNALVTAGHPSAYGAPIKGVANLNPFAFGEAGLEASNGLFVHPKNIIVGISRKIRLEMERDIRARGFIFVLTMKLDSKFEEEAASAKIVNIKED